MSTTATMLRALLFTSLAAGCTNEPTGIVRAPRSSNDAPPMARGAPLRDLDKAAVVGTRTLTQRERGRGRTSRFTEHFTIKLAGGAPPRIMSLVRDGGVSIQNGQPPIPVGLISVPAIRATAACVAEREWRQERREHGLDLVVRGRTDAPYTYIDISANGAPIGTVSAKWKRLPDRWILVKQSFESADRSIRDEVTFDHVAALRTARELPEQPCPGGGDAQGRGLPMSSEAVIGSDECIDDPAAKCWLQNLKVIAATSAAAAAGTAMVAACAPVQPAVPLTCAAATFTYVAALSLLAAAQWELEQCLLLNGGQLEDATPASRIQWSSTTRSAECGGTGDGSSGGSAGGSYWIEICAYLDHYDENGSFLYTETMGCWTELVNAT